MNRSDLDKILKDHKEWRQSGGERGKRADLGGAYLRDAYLGGANLGGAYLRDAYLRGAYLRDADLRDANLGGADLGGAYLRDAYLGGANLGGAYLRDAYLRDANLGDAYLRDANLGGADLGGAYLRDADLGGADLGGAYLGGANLGGAYLRGAYLRDADLRDVKADLYKVLEAAPNEVGGLLEALKAGKVDGTAYEGKCACLVGTIANVRGCAYTALEGLKPDQSRPSEQWFLAISPGHTPEKSQVVALTVEWIEEWQKARAESATVGPK